MQKVIQSIAGKVQITNDFTIKEDSKKKKGQLLSRGFKEEKRSKAKITETSYRKLVKIKPDTNEIECKIIFKDISAYKLVD